MGIVAELRVSALPIFALVVCVLRQEINVLRSTRSVRSSTTLKSSGDYDDDFADRLQAAIDEAREEIERETEQYRQDLEQSYKSKVGVVKQVGR